jgi:hypothetical protein
VRRILRLADLGRRLPGQGVMRVGVDAIQSRGVGTSVKHYAATISDQVPKFQRASVSALLGIAQNVGILGGTYLAQHHERLRCSHGQQGGPSRPRSRRQ